ncbi:PucR family transcriptional regulator [Staphylococcus agnetis]|uniref:PucR family transcriptional regulator n=2 Tax=Staphylococcus agnetis TaxID=985762 RepID=UPI00208E4660|nr:helix-turn-helix domain-containing protein [Staphylococcus agnetis]
MKKIQHIEHTHVILRLDGGWTFKMRKEYWAQKTIKKTASIIKKDILITNQSGQVIAASTPNYLGQSHKAALHSVNRNVPIEIENEDMKFWNVDSPCIVTPFEHDNTAHGTVIILGQPDEIRDYSRLLKLNAEFVINQEKERAESYSNQLSRTQMLSYILFNQERQIQNYNRKGIIDQLGLNEQTAVALIHIETTSKSKIRSLRDALDKWKLPTDDIIETSPQDYIYLFKSNKHRGTSLKALKDFISNQQDDILKKTMITIGAFNMGVQGLIQSYNEAMSLQKLIRTLRHTDGVHTYKEYELETICNNISYFTPSNETSLVTNYKKLLDFGEDKYLNETVEAYFRNHGKLVKTANDLFIHRNTLNYRIKKIHDITGWDPNTIDGIVLLRIAQMLYKKSK